LCTAAKKSQVVYCALQQKQSKHYQNQQKRNIAKPKMKLTQVADLLMLLCTN
jgi:hypothetical protein